LEALWLEARSRAHHVRLGSANVGWGECELIASRWPCGRRVGGHRTEPSEWRVRVMLMGGCWA
jgi:hypothetical protein